MAKSKTLKEGQLISYGGYLYHSWKFKNPKGADVKCKALSGTGEITIYKNSRKVGMPYIVSATDLEYPTAVYLNTGTWRNPVTRTLQVGETLLKVAREYGVSINNLLAENNIKESDPLFPGTVLSIPDSEWEVWIKELSLGRNKFKVELLSQSKTKK